MRACRCALCALTRSARISRNSRMRCAALRAAARWRRACAGSGCWACWRCSRLAVSS
jgi:hypothetical protein